MGMENVQAWISISWLPDETISIDECPQTVTLPRRYYFRYLRVEVIDTSPKYKVSFSDISCECVSAIGQDHALEMVDFGDRLLEDIHHVSISTLSDCMQTVFEDGPRRDRRLWIGDLRRQALANYSTLRDFNLVKRCVFQFAAVVHEDGSLPTCIFEKPSLSQHFVANDQEHERVGISANISERALREIHLLPFQISIADANPGAIMTYYNKVNGQHVSESKEMLDGLLRRNGAGRA
ncbi:hypothetical protein PENSUB_1042 [Penicillium subrubescens]|uniref:beta-glucosidase n=1 Tax=Penicillium subrubescens TaxID=1316194 RepID=A0A1Q5ULG6_9EURO|nr:hypothetical protein PENSUB_1042 [Penicillium subrubescens]